MAKRRGWYYDHNTNELVLEVDGVELARFDGINVQLSFFGVTPGTKPTAYTQDYTTADKTHIADGSSDVTTADAGTVTTADAVAIAEGSADGVAAGGFASALARQAAMNKVDAIVTLANETKADYNAAATLANEQKAAYNLLRAQVLDLKQLVNSVIDDLQTLGLVQ